MDKFFVLLNSDCRRFRNNFSPKIFLHLFLAHPGFRSIVFLRLTKLLYEKKLYKLSNLSRFYLIKNFGIDYIPGGSIGCGLRIEHPVGIVIGKGVEIGDRATIMSGVVIGEKYVDSRSNREYPKIGNNVVIGAGSIIIGKINIGNNVVIGAGSIITKSVKSNSIVYGTK